MQDEETNGEEFQMSEQSQSQAALEMKDTVLHEDQRIEGLSGSSPNRSDEQTLLQDEETNGEEFSQVELEMKDRRVVIKQQVLTLRSSLAFDVVHWGSTDIFS